MYRRALRSRPVRIVAHGMYPAGINPAVIEIEEGAHGYGVIDGFVGKALLVKSCDICWADVDRVEIYLADESKERLIGSAELRCFQIGKNASH